MMALTVEERRARDRDKKRAHRAKVLSDPATAAVFRARASAYNKTYYARHRDDPGFLESRYTANNTRKREEMEALAGRPRPERCELCGGPPRGNGTLHFDHCHKTGRFRGWLCNPCNRLLGLAGDDPTRLDKGAAYLRAGGIQ